jgi:hypothetical protein
MQLREDWQSIPASALPSAGTLTFVRSGQDEQPRDTGQYTQLVSSTHGDQLQAGRTPVPLLPADGSLAGFQVRPLYTAASAPSGPQLPPSR